MKFQQAFAIAALPAVALSFPFLGGGGSKEDILNQLNKRAALEDRSLSSLLTTIVADVEGLIGSAASSVSPSDLRPQPGYTFQAPSATDSRGPCPGLNLLANYGYLPRNGYVTYSQVVNATAEGFNMGADLSTILAVFAILADGDIETESWYLGAGPGDVGGLNRHSTVEADVSPNREDYYLGCGDNHHVSSRLFTQNVQLLLNSTSKQFDLGVMGQQYAKNAAFSQKYNPFLYYFPFPSIVSLGAFAFYPNFFSNGTYRAGGVANYESISSIIGAQLNVLTGHFEYVPEKWPKNWYRRSTEYGAVEALTDALTYIYPEYPLPMPFAQIGSANLNANTILCDIYQGFNSITPLALAGSEADAAAGVTWALSKLAPFIAPSVLGCPATTLSPDFLYPNQTQEGSSTNPPPSVVSNTGNNTYSKVYFTAAPTSPSCSHSYSS